MKTSKKSLRSLGRKSNVSMSVGHYTFTVMIEPNDPDGYLVTCPALPGLVTQGDSLDEAYSNAADAIEGYLQSLIKHGEPIPSDKVTIPVRVLVA
jgi:antitoxin HicB